MPSLIIAADRIEIENDYTRITIKRIEHSETQIIVGRDLVAMQNGIDFVNRVAQMHEIPQPHPLMHQIPDNDATQMIDAG